MSTRIAVAGAAGRMGRAILTLALQDKSLQISGALEQKGSSTLGEDLGSLLGVKNLSVSITDQPAKAVSGADVLIDFTHPSATTSHLDAVLQAKKTYVLGTTGLDEKIMEKIRAAGKSIAIVQSPNMSVGVNLLFKLAELTARALDESYDIELAETHHRMKKDSPSGTAAKLVEIVASARKKNLKKDVIYGREGQVGERPKGQIGVFALRGGDVVGDHILSFLGDGERLELTHRATSRDAFAQGALRAAKFVAGQRPGLYNMSQVLGIA